MPWQDNVGCLSPLNPKDQPIKLLQKISQNHKPSFSLECILLSFFPLMSQRIKSKIDKAIYKPHSVENEIESLPIKVFKKVI